MLQFLLSTIILLSSPSELQLNGNKSQNKIFPVIYQLKQKPKRSAFLQHFALLDSIVKANPYDTIYCCYKASVEFMVRSTKIEISTGANIAGRSSFSKSDLVNWHAWFDKKYRRKVRD